MCVNAAYSDFVNKFMKAIDSVAIIKKQDWGLILKLGLTQKERKKKKTQNVHRKKRFYLEENLDQNSKNLKELRWTLNCLRLNAKKRYKADWCLTKDGTIWFEPCISANVFVNFYSELATNLLINLPIAPNKFISDTTKDYYTDIFNNKKTNFNYSTHPKMLLETFCLA